YNRHQFDTRLEAAAAVARWISEVYNSRRRHSALGYIDPITFEQNMIDKAARKPA
ncbi:integrase core domain-containing protein, partial [Gordonia oryzae]|uniref:integrase core domain-containing protein n=1 Tax=Gordonia oryzae TaxID=2487349 RepID=UPI003F88029A